MTAQLLAAPAGAMSTGESVVFVVLGIAAIVGAVGMVLARNAVHSALFLVMTMLSLGVFYFVQQAPFLGVVQIIVYTGAIMILFLFVLMIIGRNAVDSLVETIPGQRITAAILGLAFAGLVGATVYRGVRDITARGIPDVNASVAAIAASLFHDYVFAFELTSALLITAAVGAMVLAHVERPPGTRMTQRQLAQARFRGVRPQPLPGPGVLATSHSIATPALLPDGSIAPDSVSPLVEPELAAASRRGQLPAGTPASGDGAGGSSGQPHQPSTQPRGGDDES